MRTIALEEWVERHSSSRAIARERKNVKFSCKNAKNRALILTYIDK